MHAFNISETLRMPVIILSDKELAMTKCRVDTDDLKPIPVQSRSMFSGPGPFIPYHFERPEDVPLFARFGGEWVVRSCTSSHNEGGYITKDIPAIAGIVEHLQAKVDSKKDIFYVTKDIQPGAKALVISYGITARSSVQALNMLRNRGAKVSHLNLHTLWPVPERIIRDSAKDADVVIVPELNLGLYRREIERVLCNKKVTGINRMDTQLISPEDIVKEVEHALG
jgi:2-oxoglutarate/2-oxoacid ferredoxin oxidoreductase subunit alpha